MMGALFTGSSGRVIAAAGTLAVVAVLWLGALGPSLDWFTERGEHLSSQRALAARMAAAVAAIPALQKQASEVSEVPQAAALLAGANDAVAGAALQQAVQDGAARTGVSVASSEILPGEPVGGLRRISLRVAASGTLTSLVAMLKGFDQANPRVLIDDLAVRQALALGSADQRLDASFTAIGFTAAATR